MNDSPRPDPSRSWRRLFKLPLFLLRTGSWPLARWLASHDAALSADLSGLRLADLAEAWKAAGHWDELMLADGEVRSRTLDLPLRAGSIPTVGFQTLRHLIQRGFRAFDCDGRIHLKKPGLELRLTSPEKVDIAREVFLEGSYSFSFAGSWVVFDIGANAGFASLAFADEPWVSRVIAYEPFEATATEFESNLALNPGLASKIALHRLAWSDRDGTVAVEYNQDRSGSMSVESAGANGTVTSTPGIETKVVLRRASSELARHLPSCAAHPIFVKLDCEGSEYPVIRDLEATGMLAKVAALVIEWHYAPPAELTERLAKAGFSLHVRPVRESNRQGLIFAWRQASHS